MDKSFALLYDRLFETRLEGDYEDFVRIDVADVRAWLPRAAPFVAEAAALLERDAP